MGRFAAKVMKAVAEARGITVKEAKERVDPALFVRVVAANEGRDAAEVASLVMAEQSRVSRTLAFVAAVADERETEGVAGGPDLGVGGMDADAVVASLAGHASAKDALKALFAGFSARVETVAAGRPEWRAVRPQMGSVALATAVYRAFLEGRTPEEAVESVLREQAGIWKDIVRAGIDGYAESRGVPAGEVRGDGFSFARNRAFAAGVPAKDFLAGHLEIHEMMMASYAAAKAAAEHRAA